ncbi:hypothetical protein C4J93_3044 [Pseudomonas sp. R2-37-08W]|nr:hypothetical protein C4J93_3044 [Pseudomonas sp. R2-37-08W]
MHLFGGLAYAFTWRCKLLILIYRMIAERVVEIVWGYRAH